MGTAPLRYFYVWGMLGMKIQNSQSCTLVSVHTLSSPLSLNKITVTQSTKSSQILAAKKKIPRVCDLCSQDLLIVCINFFLFFTCIVKFCVLTPNCCVTGTDIMGKNIKVGLSRFNPDAHASCIWFCTWSIQDNLHMTWIGVCLQSTKTKALTFISAEAFLCFMQSILNQNLGVFACSSPYKEVGVGRMLHVQQGGSSLSRLFWLWEWVGV